MIKNEVLNQIFDLFDYYLYTLLDWFTGFNFRPFAVILLTLTVFIPIFCGVVKKVFS